MIDPVKAVLAALDAARRRTGRALAAAGLGPRTTPSVVVDVTPWVRLRHLPGAGTPVLRGRQAARSPPSSPPAGPTGWRRSPCWRHRCGSVPGPGGSRRSSPPPRLRWCAVSPGAAVPGAFLDVVSAAASPREFAAEPRIDLLRSLADPTTLGTHLRVLRWAADEFSMPGALFRDVVGQLYRDDAFARGTLEITGERIGPARLTAPLTVVVDPRSGVIPPASVVPV